MVLESSKDNDDFKDLIGRIHMAKKAKANIAKTKKTKETPSTQKKGRMSRFSKIAENKKLFEIVQKLKIGKKVEKTAKDLTGDNYVGTTTRKKTIELYKKIATISFTKSTVNPRKFSSLIFTRV